MKELIQALINQGIITAADIQRMTTLELLLTIVERVNELHGMTKEGLEAVQRLLDNGVQEEVIGQLDKWTQDGTFDSLINQSAFKELNDCINETNAQLSTKLDKNSVLSMGNMGQDVKEAMTGGSVAVVGENTILSNNIVDNQVNEYKVTFMNLGNNLIREDRVYFNKTIDTSSGLLVESSGYISTDFIEVEYSKEYHFEWFKEPPTNAGVIVIFYDNDKTIIKNSFVTLFNFTNLSDCKYIRICFPNYDLAKLKKSFLTADEVKKTPKLKNEYLDLDHIKRLIDFNDSFYKDKKITCYGDSITAQNQWQPHVENYFGCTMINKGVGGTTVHNNGHKEVIEGVERDSWMCSDDRINLIPLDSDVILCFGGANDWGYPSMEMGTTGDGNLIDSQFKNAYSLMLKKIINRCPNARIITMTPIGGRTSSENENEDKEFECGGRVMNDFSLAVQEVSQYFGIPCINIHGESGISTLNHTKYIADIIHPNSEGGKMIANAVINGMKRFEPIIF